jgi:hypothetical protein
MSKNKTQMIQTGALCLAALLGLAGPAMAATGSGGGLPTTDLVPGEYETNSDVPVAHTVQEDGVGFGGDLSLPPLWGGDSDKVAFPSTMLPPEKAVDRRPRDVIVEKTLLLFDLPMLIPDLGLHGLGLPWGDAFGVPTFGDGGLDLAPPRSPLLREFQFDPSPSSDISFEDALSAGIVTAGELADLAAPATDSNPFVVETPMAAVPGPAAVAVFGVASLFGRRRRR